MKLCKFYGEKMWWCADDNDDDDANSTSLITRSLCELHYFEEKFYVYVV